MMFIIFVRLRGDGLAIQKYAYKGRDFSVIFGINPEFLHLELTTTLNMHAIMSLRLGRRTL